MNLRNRIKHLATGVLCMSVSLTAFGQDLIASQAPVDRKLKAVDSVALQRLIKAEEANAGLDLYSSWNNNTTHCYSSAAVPDSFKIDLRGFAMPTTSRNITSRFGYRPAFRRMHKGLDVKVYTGDTIYAAFSGKVRIVKYEAGGYGNYIVLRHNNGLETIYGHLSKQLVRTDQTVKAGEPIGLGGNTGRSFGSHLHFETRILGEAIDPALLFDFANQDVTADYFVFRKSGNSSSGYKSLASNRTEDRQHDTRPSSGASHFYQVKKGDNIYSISKKLGISVDKLCSANNLNKKSKIRPKQILKY